jgi:(p)ppGpp synthase/HD superfamily hydrolase
MSDLGKAIRIASEVFEHHSDKGGNPYMLHCIRVMQGVEHLGKTAMIAAILHDVVEDSHWTFEMLHLEGFSSEVIVILELLTHRKETEYMDYIKALSVHPIAKAIKLSDLRDNSNITRLKGLREKDFARLQKYAYAYEYLKD